MMSSVALRCRVRSGVRKKFLTSCCVIVLPPWILSDARLSAARTRARGTERSEEHTSELQSRLHLVCRLLLDKNNVTSIGTHSLRHVQVPCSRSLIVALRGLMRQARY